jgi:ADP-ribose pyrophosphatase YjhB (NUDIX family)
VADPRRFTRFAEGRSAAEGYWPLPPDGLCLSSFVLLSPVGGREEVLVGKLDPKAPWSRIGALDPHRVQLNASGWMLPSCHLLYFEPPVTAAQRILKEQLALEDIRLEPPMVFSESYRSPRHPERDCHWDIEFVFRGALPAGTVLRHPAWSELRLVDPSKSRRSSFTRSHDEILELAGYRIG